MAKVGSMQDRLLAIEEGGFWDIVMPWLRAHRLALGGVFVLILLLAVGSIYWRYQKAAAMESLRQGIVALQMGEAQKAADALQRIHGASFGNREKALGLFYLGEAYASLGRRDDALRSYGHALTAIKGGAEAYFEQLLILRSAQVLESSDAEGSGLQAQKKYEQAAVLDGPLTVEAIAAAGRLAEKLNNHTAAKAHYEKLASVGTTHPLAEVFHGKVGK